MLVVQLTFKLAFFYSLSETENVFFLLILAKTHLLLTMVGRFKNPYVYFGTLMGAYRRSF